ncbi:hypothetical protein AAF712_006436 [Marasmius tenuissimus]|uniref:MYND-type domain-containing protein n=1 Tax=Marasmius tenuissimus TaxID=585030 RepID=A0ABR2ZY55_9AGAR
MWPSIAGWTVTLLKAFVLEGTPTTSEGIAFRDTLVFGASGIPRLLEHTVPTQACAHTPDFIPTLLNVVIRLAEIDHPAFEHFWRQLCLITQNYRDLTSQFINIIFKLHYRCNIAKIILRIIMDESGRSGCPDVWVLEACLTLLEICCIPVNLYQPLRTLNAPYHLAYTLYRLATKRRKLRGGEYEPARSTVLLTCNQLVEAFKDGSTWVIQTLDAHILLALADLQYLTVNLDDPDMPYIGDLFKTTISVINAMKPFLVYRSVLIRVLREGRRARKRHPPGSEQWDANFWIAFDKFQEEARKMKIILDEFDKNPKYGMGTAYCCTYQKCSRKGRAPETCESPDASKTKVKRCEGCHVATYCSLECQRSDWRGSHRMKCKELSAHGPTTGISDLPSHLDLSFIKFLVRRDLLAKQSMFMHRQLIVAQYNYRKAPMEFSTVSVGELLGSLKRPDTLSVRDALLDLSKELSKETSQTSSVKHQQIVYILLPGTDPHTRLVYAENLDFWS